MKRIEELIYDLKNDRQLYEKFLEIIGSTENIEDKSIEFLENIIIDFAKENGYDVSLEDIVENYFTNMHFIDSLENDSSELDKISLDDLEKISGGLSLKNNAKILAAIQFLTVATGMYSAKADTIDSGLQSSSTVISQKNVKEADNKKSANEIDILSLLKENKNLPEISEENPFNEVDAMVFCNLTYLPGNMLPLLNKENISDGITIEKWATNFKNNFENKSKSLNSRDDINLKNFKILVKKSEKMYQNRYDLLSYAAKCPRYKNILVGNFVSETKEFPKNIAEQFAAMTFTLKDGKKIVSFRGTDSTITGWKEDFDMSYETEVPAQKDSIKYLSNILDHYADKNIDIIGHSKGGNLAVYSAFNLIEKDNSLGNKIGTVYNLDGPGIRDDIYEKFSKETLNIANEKVVLVRPQSSVVGRMMCNCIGGKKIYAKSSSDGIFFQHDALTWMINKDFYKKDSVKFISEKVRPESELIEEMLFNFVKRSAKEDRRIFVDTTFNFAINNNVDLTNMNIMQLFRSIVYKYAIQGKSVSQIFSIAWSPSKALVLDEKEKESLTNVLNIMSEEFFKAYWKHFDEVNKSLGIPKEVANQLKDYSGKNLSVSDVVKIGIKSYVMKFFKVYAIKDFIKKLI